MLCFSLGKEEMGTLLRPCCDCEGEPFVSALFVRRGRSGKKLMQYNYVSRNYRFFILWNETLMRVWPSELKMTCTAHLNPSLGYASFPRHANDLSL